MMENIGCDFMSGKKRKWTNKQVYTMRRILVVVVLFAIIFIIVKLVGGIFSLFRGDSSNAMIDEPSKNIIDEIDFEVNPVLKAVEDNKKEIYKSIDDRADYYERAVKVRETVMGKASAQDPNEKVIYLTFDDGPTKKITPQVLDILDRYNVKATFFIVGDTVEKNPDLVKRIYDGGHTIGNHTYSHDYNYIYSDVENLIDDIDKLDAKIKEIVGDEFEGKVFRFPGGSHSEAKIPFKEELDKLKYIYFDWNVINGDAEGHNIPAETLIARTNSTMGSYSQAIILMHDSSKKQTTVDALPSIIENLQSRGFEFKTLGEV